ncbi:MAG: pirin family protein [Bacilli bacterium]|nr:pirin family protein [Bacilli bacterium]MDD4006074.1 pirin family protein [Bacilli bacterium]
MQRKVLKQVTGYKTTDGAGVNLVRFLSRNTVEVFDPILMLDSFDSVNPRDYIAGFPLHPHRGIETISYIYRGKMVHKDSLGNEDMIQDGEVQWMTAGSGIMHEEKLPASERMLGVQLWLNLASKNKMVAPAYLSVKADQIKEVTLPDGRLCVLAGSYEGQASYQSKYQPLDYYDIHLNPHASFAIKTDSHRSIMLFTLVGSIVIEGVNIKEKTAVKLSEGDTLRIQTENEGAQILFVSSLSLNEPVAWGGPIVMNTKEELYRAFQDLDEGTFLKQNIKY